MSDPNGNIAWWAIGVVGGYVSYRQKGYVDWRYIEGRAIVGATLRWGATPNLNGGIQVILIFYIGG